MSVTLRCPNCGTTRTTLGECDACHEAQARYFCTNHTPGVWLDAPACPKCGARFGDPPRRSAPPAAIPSRPRSPARAAASSPPPSHERMDPAWDGRGEFGRADEEHLEPSPPPMPLWQKLLRDAARAREMARRTAPSHETRSVVRGAGGCLMRLMLLMVLLFVALVAVLFLFGGALLQGFF